MGIFSIIELRSVKSTQKRVLFVFLQQIKIMLSILKKYRIYIGIVLVFSIITLYLFYSALKPSKSLPIYNPADVNPELVDTTVQYISKYHTIADFSFVNQNGKTITQKDYDGKIYVADFFFTT
jgi:protein SCO1/2